MDLKHLRAFVTVADTGNVTRASALLNLVQPAVSRQLRLLEEDVGAQLFERGRHGMQLTDAGKSMLEYARRILNEVERARAEIRPSQGAVAGIVTVGLLASTSELLAGPLVADVARSFPDIRLRVLVGYAGHLLDWLEHGDVDAALLYDRKPAASLHVKPLVQEQLWVVAPSSARLRAGKPVSAAQLAVQPLVLPSAPEGLRALIDRALAAAAVQVRVAAETNALDIQRNLVRDGLGWTILPLVAVAEQVRQGLLSAAPLAVPAPERRIVLAASASRQATAPVRCVVGVLLECMQAAIRDGRWPAAKWLGSDSQA